MQEFFSVEIDSDVPQRNVTQWMSMPSTTVDLLECQKNLSILPLDIYFGAESYVQLLSSATNKSLHHLIEAAKARCGYSHHLLALFAKNVHNSFPFTLEWTFDGADKKFTQPRKAQSSVPSEAEGEGYQNLMVRHRLLKQSSPPISSMDVIGFSAEAVKTQFLVQSSLNDTVLLIPKTYAHAALIDHVAGCLNTTILSDSTPAKDRKLWSYEKDEKFIKLSLNSFHRVAALVDRYIDIEAVSEPNNLHSFLFAVGRFDEQHWCMDGYEGPFNTDAPVSSHIKLVFCFTTRVK